MSRPNLGLRLDSGRGTASRMDFGKIAFGTLLLAVGVLLLAVRVGFAHPDTPVLLLRYWPLLLVAFGLAFLAGAIKNPFLGCFSIFLILGGTVLGLFWMHALEKRGKLPHASSSLDLRRAGISSLTVRVHSFAGKLDFMAADPRSETVMIARRDAAGDSSVGYSLDISGGKGVLAWPRGQSLLGVSPLGARIEVRAPGTIPVALSWTGRLASLQATFARLKPTHCVLHEIFSTARLDFDDSSRPSEIRAWGFASNLEIRIPADCPVVVVSRSSLVLRDFPSDFEEHAPGRGKNRIDAAEGRGAPVRILVDGPFIRIKIERMPVTAVSTQEELEWQRPESTASRSLSPSS